MSVSTTGVRWIALALLTRMSRPPNVATACSIALLTCASSRTSTTRGRALPPALEISSAAVKMVPGSFGCGFAAFGRAAMVVPRREREQPQIRRRAGKRRGEVVALAAEEPIRRALQRLGRVLQPHPGPAERGVIGGVDGFDGPLDFANISPHRRTACERQFAR